MQPPDLATVTRLYDAYMHWRLQALAWLTAQQQDEPAMEHLSRCPGADAA